MKTNLVTIQNQKAVTSSLQVAKYFQILHKNVLQAIRNLECSDKFKELNFQPSFYIKDLTNRGQHKYPMYYMTKDGFSFLVMGFTGKAAAKFKEEFINAFNQMEEYIKQQAQAPKCDQPKGRRVETYLSSEEFLRLQTAVLNYGHKSVSDLIKKLILDFLNHPFTLSQSDWIEQIEKECENWKSICDERNKFVSDMLPFIQEMNRTIDEERTLRKKYERQLKQIRAFI